MACICCGPTGCGRRIPREVSVSFTTGDVFYSNYQQGQCPDAVFRSMIDGTRVCGLISFSDGVALYSSQTPAPGINFEIRWACLFSYFGTVSLSGSRCGTSDELCYRYTNFDIWANSIGSNALYQMPNLVDLTPGVSQSFLLSVVDNRLTGGLGHSDIFSNCGDRPFFLRLFKAEIVVQPIW